MPATKSRSCPTQEDSISSDNTDLKYALSHILWIGGGTDAGKTTVAEAIVKRHDLQYYNFDRHERSQIDRIAAGYYEKRKNPDESTPDELWVDPHPEDMARGIIQGWARRAEVSFEDLLAMPRQPLIIAEGTGYFPELILPLMATLHQAIWFVPEAQFKRKIAIQRGKPSVRNETRNPALATENIITRDLLITQHIRQEATVRGLRLIEVDGKRSIEETIALVEEHFAPYLTPTHL